MNMFGGIHNTFVRLFYNMSEYGEDSSTEVETAPWPEQLLDSEWLLALAAILYFTLSYIVWGLIDILSTPAG